MEKYICKYNTDTDLGPFHLCSRASTILSHLHTETKLMSNSQRSYTIFQSSLICLEPLLYMDSDIAHHFVHAPLYLLPSIDYCLGDVFLSIRADSIVFLADNALSYFMTWFHLSP